MSNSIDRSLNMSNLLERKSDTYMNINWSLIGSIIKLFSTLGMSYTLKYYWSYSIYKERNSGKVKWQWCRLHELLNWAPGLPAIGS